MRAVYVTETNTSFTKDKIYELHLHSDCIHAIDDTGFHYRVLEYCEPSSLKWFFCNFTVPEEQA